VYKESIFDNYINNDGDIVASFTLQQRVQTIPYLEGDERGSP
jgi:hypothetical protein